MCAGRRYYIVVRSRANTISCVFAALLTLCSAGAWGQQPKRLKEPIPVPLLPAEPAWFITLAARPAAGGALDDERAYVPLTDGQLVALQRQTGVVVWSKPLAGSTPPVVAGGVVYVAGLDALHAVDATDGSTRWTVPLDAFPSTGPALVGDRIALLAGTELIAFRSTDGARLWVQTLDAVEPPATLVGSAQAAFVGMANRVIRVDPMDGTVRWTRALPATLSRPVLADDRVIVGSTANGFYALDADSGSIEWKWTAGGDGSGAAVLGKVVFLTSLDNMVKAVNVGNGHQRWRQETGTRPILPPIATGGIVVVAGLSPSLATFNAKTGAPIATYEAPAPLQGSPLMDPVLRPFRVAVVLVLRNGMVVGLNSVGLQFRDPPLLPLTVLPGRLITREQPPAAVRPR
jgi:outer membrane protein assembly factor BamB